METSLSRRLDAFTIFAQGNCISSNNKQNNNNNKESKYLKEDAKGCMYIKDVVEVDINSNQTTVSTKESKRKKLDDETDKVKLITEVNLKKLTSQMENDAKEVKFRNIFFCLNSMN